MAKEIGATVKDTTQKALQADGVIHLAVIGETYITLSRDHLSLKLDVLMVDNLDEDVLAGTSFMVANDVSVEFIF